MSSSVRPEDHSEFDDFATQPITPDDLAARNSYGEIARQIGDYTLIERIGSGGMGEVWVAEQLLPVKRSVALKLIKPGMASHEAIARFEAERQALAIMNHPNIAQILDVGATDDGQPYFVMALVNGVPLNQYCDQRKLNIEDRLKLFLEICAGVQHAHQKGVIHRDLKPANILVGDVDGVAIPKIIDFGLVKAIEDTAKFSLADQSTKVGQLLGTAMYMSPEQASLGKIDVDTRTDIYALGVILYEQLTGLLPLDHPSIREGETLDLLDLVRTFDPLLPSRRVSEINIEGQAAVTEHRKTDQSRLRRILAGDLDWIVMKALDKDRSRRYDSASGFADDIRRYLNSEPVVARPPSFNYRVRKFVRKHRVGVFTTLALALTLLIGLASTGIALLEARKQARLADRESKAKDLAYLAEAEQRGIAEQNERIALDRLANVETSVAMLGRVFSSLDPNTEYGTLANFRNAMRESVQEVVNELESANLGDPLVVAELQNVLGLSLARLGDATTSLDLFGKSYASRKELLGEDHLDTFISMGNLAAAYSAAGLVDEALPLFRTSLEKRRQFLAEDDPLILAAMYNLAGAYKDAGQFKEARELLQETLALAEHTLGLNHIKTVTTRSSLANILMMSSEYQQASQLLEGALANIDLERESPHPELLNAMVLLATCYQKLDRPNEALPLFQAAIDKMEAVLGRQHPNFAKTMLLLADAYHEDGKLDEAGPLYSQALEIMQVTLGTSHPDTKAATNNLAIYLVRSGKGQEALPLLEQLVEWTEVELGQRHPNTLSQKLNLAVTYHSMGRIEDAITLFEDVLPTAEVVLGATHYLVLPALNNLALCYKEAGNFEESISNNNKVLKLMQEHLGESHPQTLNTMANLGMAYSANGDGENAVRMFLPYLDGMKSRQPANRFLIPNLQATIALELLKCKQFSVAEELLRECLAIRNEIQPDAWSTYNVQSMLGEALMRQDKLKEAEPLLIEGYEGLVAVEASIPTEALNRLPEALDRLIQIYTVLQRPDDLMKFQKLRHDLK